MGKYELVYVPDSTAGRIYVYGKAWFFPVVTRVILLAYHRLLSLTKGCKQHESKGLPSKQIHIMRCKLSLYFGNDLGSLVRVFIACFHNGPVFLMKSGNLWEK